MPNVLSRNPFVPRIGDDLQQQSEWARFLTRAARAAAPEDAQKLGETAARILHAVVSSRRPTFHGYGDHK